MSNEHVTDYGFGTGGVQPGSKASDLMSREAKASGGGVSGGGATSTLQKIGGTGDSRGYSPDGISKGSPAAHNMSHEARSSGGGVNAGGTTSTVQSVSMGGNAGVK
ncbi:keratin, type II cytoskeletal 2 epidermal-like [Polypterus senegalus]|uniref:keratin, type II cytoskeletal 2 epidermal-like n=1 Tax=Polypterus senegalus TaxID=55291 RepID=UPI0019643AC3|nr:keratin, type II cytoskeletal 2 epidermal-like [Polypterus senegalus]